MKKIVGILGMAAMLGSAAFAADPAANFALSEFTGSAEFGVKANFAREDVELGMYNNASAGIKFGFVTAGDKATTGDGVWGELKIKADATDATAIPAAAVDTAKIHVVNGDFSVAMNLLKPSLVYGGFAPASATPSVAAKVTGAAADRYSVQRAKWETDLGEAANPYEGKVATGKFEELEKAEAALKDATDNGTGDLYKLWDKVESLKGEIKDLQDKLAKLPAKPADSKAGIATAGIGKDDGLAAGFGIEMKMADMFALNFKLMDAGLKVNAKDQKYGMAFDASLLAVENLEASIAMSMNFDLKYTGLQAKAGYNFAINDKLYVKPAVAYEMVKAGDADATNALAAGVLFGWGAKGIKPAIDYFQNDKGELEFNEGVSVTLCPIIEKDNTNFLMTVGIYDQSLFNMLGLEDFGVLKTAFGFDTYITKEDAANTVRAALAYDVTFSPVYVSAHFGMNAEMANKDAKFEPEVKFGVKLGSKEVIDNTDVYASYEFKTSTAKDAKASVNELTIGTKISF